MNEPQLSRRDFLKVAQAFFLTAAGLFGLVGLLRYLSYQTDPPSQEDFDLGLVVDYPPGSRTPLPQVPALLIHGEVGFTALSLLCPHLGCTVQTEAEGFACPCHGSRFDSQGRLLRGPAADPLTVLRVETTPDGHLHLYTT
jgi:cytochrome b6-f complex iron-sulfur subunit